jgi:hypothetical protein
MALWLQWARAKLQALLPREARVMYTKANGNQVYAAYVRSMAGLTRNDRREVKVRRHEQLAPPSDL